MRIRHTRKCARCGKYKPHKGFRRINDEWVCWECNSQPPGCAKPLRDMTEPELKELLGRVAEAVRGVLGCQSQFVVLCFDDPSCAKGGRQVAQYVSSCHRADMICALAAHDDVQRDSWGW